MTKIRGILFDLDGVLINSEPLYTRFWQQIDVIYPTGVENFAHVIKGNTLSKILSTYFPADIHADITSRLLRFEQTAEYPPFPEAFALLTKLRSLGLKIALVTSSNNDKMANLYAQHPHFKAQFNAIVTADDVTLSKPDPQGYLIAAERLEINPKNCIVVEDSPAGLDAGRNSGAFVCGLATTVSAEKILHRCDVLLNSLADLVKIVTNINSTQKSFA